MSTDSESNGCAGHSISSWIPQLSQPGPGTCSAGSTQWLSSQRRNSWTGQYPWAVGTTKHLELLVDLSTFAVTQSAKSFSWTRHLVSLWGCGKWSGGMAGTNPSTTLFMNWNCRSLSTYVVNFVGWEVPDPSVQHNSNCTKNSFSTADCLTFTSLQQCRPQSQGLRRHGVQSVCDLLV